MKMFYLFKIIRPKIIILPFINNKNVNKTKKTRAENFCFELSRSLDYDIHCGNFKFEDQCLISSFQFQSLTRYDYHTGYQLT